MIGLIAAVPAIAIIIGAASTFSATHSRSGTEVVSAQAESVAQLAMGESSNIEGVDGDSVSITVVKVRDPAVPATAADAPDPGYRLVGVQVALSRSADEQMGSIHLSDFQGAVLDSKGQQVESGRAHIVDGPPLAAEAVSTGSHQSRGWLVFEAPSAMVIASVEVAAGGFKFGDIG